MHQITTNLFVCQKQTDYPKWLILATYNINFEKLSMAILFTLRVFARNLLRGNCRRKTFCILFWCLAWGSNPGFTSNKPTHYLLDHRAFTHSNISMLNNCSWSCILFYKFAKRKMSIKKFLQRVEFLKTTAINQSTCFSVFAKREYCYTNKTILPDIINHLRTIYTLSSETNQVIIYSGGCFYQSRNVILSMHLLTFNKVSMKSSSISAKSHCNTIVFKILKKSNFMQT